MSPTLKGLNLSENELEAISNLASALEPAKMAMKSLKSDIHTADLPANLFHTKLMRYVAGALLYSQTHRWPIKLSSDASDTVKLMPFLIASDQIVSFPFSGNRGYSRNLLVS